MLRLSRCLLGLRPSLSLLCAAPAAQKSAPRAASRGRVRGNRFPPHVFFRRPVAKPVVVTATTNITADGGAPTTQTTTTEDYSAGYLLRVSYEKKQVTLTRIAQSAAPTQRLHFSGPSLEVSLGASALPRLLAVLEGRADSAEISTRLHKGSFTSLPSTGAVAETPAVRLQMESTVSGSAEPVRWDISFDVADSVLLHRFLCEALHYSQGFYQSRIAPATPRPL